MSDRDDIQPPDYPVGYRRPPRTTRFEPGKSGNPAGRPRKADAGAGVLKEILEQPVAVRERGKRKMMQPAEVIYRKLIKQGLAGDRKAAVHMIEQFIEAGALDFARPPARGGGVVALSTERMPYAMALIMAQRFGFKVRYTPAQLAAGRAEYRRTSTPLQMQIDEAIGYADLQEDPAP